MSSGVDHYATLGVSPQADLAAIRAAYRARMRRYHPDVNRSEDALAKATAINEAYACLSDDDRRSAYDGTRTGNARAATAGTRPHAATSRPRRGQRTDWHDYPAFSPIPEPEPQPVHVRFVILGLAVLVTLITFTVTSRVSLPQPPAETVLSVGQP